MVIGKMVFHRQTASFSQGILDLGPHALTFKPPPPKEESSLTVQDLKEYTEVIRSVRKRHMPVVALLAEERAGKC